jgi:hypothetical protein
MIDQSVDEFVASMTLEEVRDFLRRVAGQPKRQIVGEEREVTLTMLRLKRPCAESNDQRSWTETYIVGSPNNCIEYRVTYFPEGEPEVYEMLKYENE